MAGSVNKVILVGNLGKDPEIRRTQDGRPIANLRIATSESWRDKNSGERREKTEWHSVVIFNENLCKVAEQYLRKGSKVYIEGALQTRKWQDQQGQDRYSTEVVLQGFNGQLTMLDGRAGCRRRHAGRRAVGLQRRRELGRRLQRARRASRACSQQRRWWRLEAQLRQAARRRDPVLKSPRQTRVGRGVNAPAFGPSFRCLRFMSASRVALALRAGPGVLATGWAARCERQAPPLTFRARTPIALRGTAARHPHTWP